MDHPEEGQSETQLSVRNFTAARAAEIASLTVQIGNGNSVSSTKRFYFQHVKPHMRRRAVSHNPKRLPSRLRQQHLAQLAKSSGGNVSQPKRPRRMHRKRPEKNILEYNRRQLNNPRWLETHVWHAKRFHMKIMWGKRIPLAPTMKCFRSLFHAARQTAIMQDMSFLACFQLSGAKNILTTGLKQLFRSSQNEIQIDSLIALSCRQELIGRVFTTNSDDNREGGSVGCVKYLWVPCSHHDEGKIIFWVHPAVKDHFVEEISSDFSLVKMNKVDSTFPESPTKDEQKYLWKIGMNETWTNPGTSVHFRNLRGCLGRIKLTGPKTLSILKEILKIGNFADDPVLVKEKQDTLWSSLEHFSSIPCDTVIPLNVIDPRLELPKKRTSVIVAVKNSTEETQILPLEQTELTSPLWDEDVRREVLRTKVTDAELSKARSENLVPGTSFSNLEKTNVIPIVLVIRSGASGIQQRVVFSGADLIVPNGWMMPFWVSLSYRCVRAYGMEFNDYLTFEDDSFLGSDSSTHFPPDSVVYIQELEKQEKTYKEKYFSRPPANRPNLITLGCVFPFSIDWARFLKCNFKLNYEPIISVLRDRVEFRELLKFLKQTTKNFEGEDTKLVQVKLHILSGTVAERSSICLPTSKDLEMFYTIKRAKKLAIEESPKFDHKHNERKLVSRQHTKILARLAIKRKKARKASKGWVGTSTNEKFDLSSRLAELDSKLICENYNKKMRSLWWNDNLEELLQSFSRRVVGLTTYAHYSFLEGKFAALGYITIGDLKKLRLDQWNKRKMFVLVRDWSKTLTYHWAELEVCQMFSVAR